MDFNLRRRYMYDTHKLIIGPVKILVTHHLPSIHSKVEEIRKYYFHIFRI